MLEATVIDIFLAPGEGDLPHRVDRATLTENGLVGDRYESGVGTFSTSNLTDGRAVTLIDEADLLWLRDTHGVDLMDGQHRRNIVVRGLDLPSLINQSFRLGTAVIRGNRPCPPCGRLSNLLGIDTKQLLKRRGGLRCDVVEPGEVSSLR